MNRWKRNRIFVRQSYVPSVNVTCAVYACVCVFNTVDTYHSSVFEIPLVICFHLHSNRSRKPFNVNCDNRNSIMFNGIGFSSVFKIEGIIDNCFKIDVTN